MADPGFARPQLRAKESGTEKWGEQRSGVCLQTGPYPAWSWPPAGGPALTAGVPRPLAQQRAPPPLNRAPPCRKGLAGRQA